MAEGTTLPLIAKHDTYSISFEVDDDADEVDRVEMRTGVPAYDPQWKVTYSRMDKINSDMARDSAQQPLQFRKIAEAAVLMGSRPADFGLEAATAVNFCTRFMG